MSPWRRLPEGAPAATPTPIGPEAIVELRVEPNGGVPNNPTLPALIYRGAFAGDHDVERIKGLFERNRWFRVWDWSVFDYHHYHPASHEVLAVARGRAAIRLGGEGGQTHELGVGDVMLLPAGFGHRRLGASAGFTVVGAYPEGQEAREIARADPATLEAALARVVATPPPATDPVYGESGPLLARWSG